MMSKSFQTNVEVRYRDTDSMGHVSSPVYYDYMQYDQSTQGHLNSDGLCFVDRHYPSPE